MVCAALFRLSLSADSLAAHQSFFGSVDSIAAGCLLAVYQPKLERSRSKDSDRLDRQLLLHCPLVAWVLACACWTAPLAALFGAVPLLLAGLDSSAQSSGSDRILNIRAAVTVGVLSYSLYLWQQPFIAARPRPWPLIPSLVALMHVCCCVLCRNRTPHDCFGTLDNVPNPRVCACGTRTTILISMLPRQGLVYQTVY